MRNLIKKIVSLGIVAGILTASVFASFVDMPSDEVEKAALTKAVENGLLNGVGDNQIAPYATITRSQMGAIVVRAMGATKEADISKFTDVSPSKWYYGEMSRAVAMGAFEGDGGVSLYPDKEITYQEAFLVLSRIFDLRYEVATALDKYEDKDKVASWAKSGVKKIVSGGYYDGAALNPTSPINRVEFAKLMDKLVANYIDTPGTYKELPEGNTLIRCDGVILDGVTFEGATTATEGDLIIIGDGVKSTDVLNANGVNVVIRGGYVTITGEVGIVRTVVSGTKAAPVMGEYGVKKYADGTKGVISAAAEGSAIELIKVVE